MGYEGRLLRQELKYTIGEHDYVLLRERMHGLLRPDEHAGPEGEYRISSLYFDNISNDAWFDKESGLQNREKYRFRIYNGQDDLIRLELKEKFGQSTAKSSRVVDRDFYEAAIHGSLKYSQTSDDPFLRRFYLRWKLEELRPCVIVEYIREPYVCRTGNVRVTFDKRLCAVINTIDLFADNQTRASPPAFANMILEVKYDDFLPLHIRELLRLSGHQRLAISKYTICRELKNALDWKELVL